MAVTYDAAIVPHVLEHVADPAAMLETVRDRLRVTDVDYFTPPSLAWLLARTGWATATLDDGWQTDEEQHVIVAVARPASSPQRPPPGGFDDTLRRLEPSLIDECVRLAKLGTRGLVRSVCWLLRRRMES